MLREAREVDGVGATGLLGQPRGARETRLDSVGFTQGTHLPQPIVWRRPNQVRAALVAFGDHDKFANDAQVVSENRQRQDSYGNCT